MVKILTHLNPPPAPGEALGVSSLNEMQPAVTHDHDAKHTAHPVQPHDHHNKAEQNAPGSGNHAHTPRSAHKHDKHDNHNNHQHETTHSNHHAHNEAEANSQESNSLLADQEHVHNHSHTPIHGGKDHIHPDMSG